MVNGPYFIRDSPKKKQFITILAEEDDQAANENGSLGKNSWMQLDSEESRAMEKGHKRNIAEHF